MAFCGPLSCFLQERGVADDPYLADQKTFYMLDLTVAPGFRGRGLGRIMKNAITLLSINRGVNAIHGRNRDRLARAMWAINLSLGSYEQQHLFDDYPDAKPFRDCLYYRCPLQWQTDNGASDLAFPQLDVTRLSSEYLPRNMPALVNRICRSGVFTESYLDDLSVVSQNFPAALRHLYSANSLSEAVDTVARAIWLKRPTATGLLTIRGHDFGAGTFLARTLSGVEEPFFAVARLEPDRVMDELQQHLETGDWLALFMQTNPMRGREDLLRQCLAICRERGLPIVFNETDPQFGTSAQLSRQPELVPDAGVVWLGGQLALAYMRDCFFDDDPLSLVNNWRNGDPYALARFAETMRQQND
jgi:GNAT superfamily N-acetyltransferase